MNKLYAIATSLLIGSAAFSASAASLSEPTCQLVDNETLYICWDQEIIPTSEPIYANLFAPDDLSEMKTVELMGPTTWIPGMEEGTTPAYNDNALIFPIGDYVAKYGGGYYGLSIAAGVVKNSAGDENEAVWWSISNLDPTGKEIGNPQISLSAEAITITWGNYNVAVNGANQVKISLYNTIESNQEFHPSLGKGLEIDGSYVIIDIEGYNLTENGSYHLEIPDGYFKLGEESINSWLDYDFVYESTGVGSLKENVEGDVIFNLNGVKKSGKDLTPGLYIVNGKKVVVK